jgi:hypothetical protein
LISSILLTTTCNPSVEVVNDVKENEEDAILLTREDSVLQLARELNINFDPNTDNINDVLDRIIVQKKSLIARLDSLDNRADAMEMAAIRYKKKENERLKNELLSEINRIKAELKRIKELSGLPDEVIKKDEFAIPEVKVPDITSTFENLPTGNYVARLDKYHLISIIVKPNGEIFVSEPRIDSTTVIKGKKIENERLKKELDQIRKKINKNN